MILEGRANSAMTHRWLWRAWGQAESLMEYADKRNGSCVACWDCSSPDRVTGRVEETRCEVVSKCPPWGILATSLPPNHLWEGEAILWGFFFSAFYLSWDYMHFRWASRVLEWVCLVLELIRCRDSRLIRGLSCSFMIWEQPGLCPPPQRPVKVHSPCPNLNFTQGGGKRIQSVHPSSIWTHIPQLYD